MMGENSAEEKKKRELLKKWVQESRNVVFLEERESPQRAEFLISEVWTAFTIRSMTIRRRQF